MKVLVLDEWLPYPADTGKKLRTYNLMRHLTRAAEVTYVYYGKGGEPLPPDWGPGTRLVAVPDLRPAKGSTAYWLRVALNVLRPLPFSAEFASSPRLVETLARLVRENPFDVLLCEGAGYARMLAVIPHPHRVLMAHNVEHLQWIRFAKARRSPVIKVFAWWQHRKMHAYETWLFRRYQRITTVSAEDRELLLRMVPHPNVQVVENGVDLDYFRPQPGERDRNRVAFSGSMDAFSNADAAAYYVWNIHPLVRARRPDAEFSIVGKDPDEYTRNLASVQGVHVTGSVPDVRPYAGRAAAAVVPLRIGGGSRLKILEAMAMGVVVVSTTIGAEGLAVTPGKDILIADQPQQFADAVLECMERGPRIAEIESRASALVRERYSWERIGREMTRMILGDQAS